jgi:hypothetical protein
MTMHTDGDCDVKKMWKGSRNQSSEQILDDSEVKECKTSQKIALQRVENPLQNSIQNKSSTGVWLKNQPKNKQNTPTWRELYLLVTNKYKLTGLEAKKVTK